MTRWISCLNHYLQIRRLRFDSLFCFFLFTSRMRSVDTKHAHQPFFDVIILTHMDFDIQVDNLGCDSRFFEVLRTRPWLPPRGTESWSAGAPWVSGFSPKGGNRLYSDGELVNVLPEKGKEDCRNPLTVLAANLTGNNSPDPWWFSSTPSWGGTLFLRRIATRASAPQNGRLNRRGEYQTLARYAQLWESHPSMGRSLGHRPVNQIVESKKAQNKQKENEQTKN